MEAGEVEEAEIGEAFLAVRKSGWAGHVEKCVFLMSCFDRRNSDSAEVAEKL